MARGADSRRVWRWRPHAHRSIRNHGGDQSLRWEFRRMPWPDVQHGHAAAAWLGRAEARIPAAYRERRTSPAIHGRDRAHRGHRYHQNPDYGHPERRWLHHQWTKGLDL